MRCSFPPMGTLALSGCLVIVMSTAVSMAEGSVSRFAKLLRILESRKQAESYSWLMVNIILIPPTTQLQYPYSDLL